jgi:hypothetical protein
VVTYRQVEEKDTLLKTSFLKMFHFTRELKKKNMWKMVKAIIVKIKKIAFQYAFINMVKEEENGLLTDMFNLIVLEKETLTINSF